MPLDFDAWFKERVSKSRPGGGKFREDEYLLDRNQTEIGVKARGRKKGVEVKGLVTILTEARTNALFPGNIEIWCKWTSDLISLTSLPTLVTRKTRWMRKYDTGSQGIREIKLSEDEMPEDSTVELPAEGCNIELTKVDLINFAWEADWWSFGFEAFGSLKSIEWNLAQAVALLAKEDPPVPPAGEALSYPAWLRLASSVGP